jgi:hypothetical protein
MVLFAPGDYIVQKRSPWPVMLVLGTRFNDLQRQVYVVRYVSGVRLPSTEVEVDDELRLASPEERAQADAAGLLPT